MVVLGITFFVGLFGAMANLRLSIDRPYRDLNFADFTVSVERAPRSVVQDLESIAGVDRVLGRLNLELPTSFPGRNADVIVGRILSLPVPDRPSVDDILLTDGRYVSQGSPGEVIAEKNFAAHHGLQVGDAVNLEAANGSWEGRIVGIAISPEYLWPARSAPEHMPDVLRRWGVLFMDYAVIGPASGLNGSINEFAFTVRDGANPDSVIDQVRTLLDPYRVTAVVPRAEQASQVILETMVGALDAVSIIFPLFFLIIVALSTYVLLTRLVHAQRNQVGVLLALGVARRRVLGHYLSFALLIGLLGSIVGAFAGYLLAFRVTDMFATQVSLPIVLKVPHWDVMASGIALSLAFTATAGVLPAYRASKENPAQTMRGESPRRAGRKHRNRRTHQGERNVSRKLALRNFRRNPVRSAFIVLALALAGSLVIVPFGFLDAMDGATRSQAESLNFDLRALLYRSVPSDVSDVVATWTGVNSAEPFVTTQAVLARGGSAFNVVLYGIRQESDVYRLYSRAGDRVFATDQGILLSAIFEKRGLQVGDLVNVSGLETRVAGFVRDFYTAGFLPLDIVQAHLGTPGFVNGLFLRLDSGASEDSVKAQMYASLPVWAVASTAKALQDTTDMLRLYYGFIGIIVAFGMTLAGAIVFNAVTINVLERNREIATMRTIGVRSRTIAQIITGENLIILALSVVLGSLLGSMLTGYFVGFFGGDTFVLDARIEPRTFVLSGLLLLMVLLLSEVPSLRSVQRLDLARATKERVG